MDNQTTTQEPTISETEIPFTVQELTVQDGPELLRQLCKLETGFLEEIGEEALTADKTERLFQAIREKKITFFLAMHGDRIVGMCSVSTCFSTFACAEVGVFDDFYVAPAFRHCGVARRLTAFCQSWCKANGLASLTVGCSAGDVAMYRALGFETQLGAMLACGLR